MKLPLLLLLLSAPVLAAPRPATVLRIEGADAFVDLGRAEDSRPGERLRVYRVIEARHPATGKVLRDRFLLGEAEVLEAGESLSRISAPSELLSQMEIGDYLTALDTEGVESVRFASASAPFPVRIDVPRSILERELLLDVYGQRRSRVSAFGEYVDYGASTVNGTRFVDRY